MKTINPEDRFKDNLTDQEVYDHCVYHLGTMKEQCSILKKNPISGIMETKCQYLREDGETCAAGYFFKPEEYMPVIENENFANVMARGYAPGRLIGFGALILTLQRVHDTEIHWTRNRKYMRQSLERIAKERNLDPSILDNPEMVWNSMLSKRDQIARMIAGPRRPLPPTVKFTMDELREIVWTSHLTSAERATYEQAADLILEQIVQPLVDALEKIKEGTVYVFDADIKEDIEVNMDAEDMATIAYNALQEY